MSSRILLEVHQNQNPLVCFKCLRIANKKCNKKFYWMSRKKSIERLLESTERPVELLYWTSAKAEDLAHLQNTLQIFILRIHTYPTQQPKQPGRGNAPRIIFEQCFRTSFLHPSSKKEEGEDKEREMAPININQWAMTTAEFLGKN